MPRAQTAQFVRASRQRPARGLRLSGAEATVGSALHARACAGARRAQRTPARARARSHPTAGSRFSTGKTTSHPEHSRGGCKAGLLEEAAWQAATAKVATANQRDQDEEHVPTCEGPEWHSVPAFRYAPPMRPKRLVRGYRTCPIEFDTHGISPRYACADSIGMASLRQLHHFVTVAEEGQLTAQRLLTARTFASGGAARGAAWVSSCLSATRAASASGRSVLREGALGLPQALAEVDVAADTLSRAARHSFGCGLRLAPHDRSARATSNSSPLLAHPRRGGLPRTAVPVRHHGDAAEEVDAALRALRRRRYPGSEVEMQLLRRGAALRAHVEQPSARGPRGADGGGPLDEVLRAHGVRAGAHGGSSLRRGKPLALPATGRSTRRR